MSGTRYVWSDEKLANIKDELKTLAEAIERIMGGENMAETVVAAGINPLQFRRLLTILDNLEQESSDDGKDTAGNRPGLISGNELLTREQKFYMKALGIEKDNWKTLIQVIPIDAAETIKWVCSNNVHLMTERETEIIRQRYVYGLTFDAIGNALNLTRERVRQLEISGMSKIRSSDFMQYLLHMGIGNYKRLRTNWSESSSEEEAEPVHGVAIRQPDKGNVLQIQNYDRIILTCGFSNRAINCLKRAGIEKVSDVAQMDIKDLAKIPHLGVKTIREIVQYMNINGLSECPFMQSYYRAGYSFL